MDTHFLIEDDEDWIERVLELPSELEMELPSSVRDRDWDVILVDAPSGYHPEHPGRMQSIYMAAELAEEGTDIFVHDINRAVEKAYSNKFLGDWEWVKDVDRLRHYSVCGR
jgi:glucuronoxylan 4-O-methyltransferase